jgi:hypothetical protein
MEAGNLNATIWLQIYATFWFRKTFLGIFFKGFAGSGDFLFYKDRQGRHRLPGTCMYISPPVSPGLERF